MQLADVLDGESSTIVPGVPNQGTFGSKHGSGANFAMCDGSVRWISNSVDSNSFQAMFTIAAGDQVGHF